MGIGLEGGKALGVVLEAGGLQLVNWTKAMEDIMELLLQEDQLLRVQEMGTPEGLEEVETVEEV